MAGGDTRVGRMPLQFATFTMEAQTLGHFEIALCKYYSNGREKISPSLWPEGQEEEDPLELIVLEMRNYFIKRATLSAGCRRLLVLP